MRTWVIFSCLALSAAACATSHPTDATATTASATTSTSTSTATSSGSSSGSTAGSSRAAYVPDVPMSDPAEYAIARVSKEAGETIFARTGIGDPYRTGIPYPIFLALLRAFPQTFGGATPALLAERFGFVPRAADPASADPDVVAGLPVGMHLTVDPLTRTPFVVNACAICHADEVHWTSPPGKAFVIGIANKRVQIHAYDAAFATITHERGFSTEHLSRLAREEATAHHIYWEEPYATTMVAAAVAAIQKRATDRAPLHARLANQLPGRVAPIESFGLVLGQLAHTPIDFAPTPGWSKVPDVIGFRARTTLSWDGTGEGSMDLLAVEADVAAGVRVAWLEKHPLQGASLGAYLRNPAPRPAYPRPINAARAAHGKILFAKTCSTCHGTYADDGRVVDYDEPIVALADIGTDPARANAATPSFTRVANDPAITRGYTRFAPSGGYVPPVLTNVWLRAPYGHVGQWPTLAAIATLPAARPKAFVVAARTAAYDLDAVGIATHDRTTPVAAGEYLYDAAQPGFANGGHPFLADLGAADARDVIEYLKTL